MRVLKFGGTSVGTADRMNEVIDIIEKSPDHQLIVLSAMSGTTNDLVNINTALSYSKKDEATEILTSLESRYVRVLTDLYPLKYDRDVARKLLSQSFELLRSKINGSSFTLKDEKEVLVQGELMSTKLFSLICELRGIRCALIPALEFMRIDEEGEPDIEATRKLIQPFIDIQDDDTNILITQGYICRNHEGEVDNLRRGGSDYTATVIGAALAVEEIQIWTDIDGVHNNDPRLVEHTRPIRRMSYREAAELAYFGAKILHPTCVLPAERTGVPLRLKCTMQPDAQGTLISATPSNRPVTAIAAKEPITAIKIYSHRMLNAYGFLKRVFQVFENHQTSVDMITTSEVAVSLTIDDTSRLNTILSDLSSFAEVEAQSGFAIVCIVGNALYDDSRYVNEIFSALKTIPIRMVSMGGSRNNISLLIQSSDKRNALVGLNALFAHEQVEDLVAVA